MVHTQTISLKIKALVKPLARQGARFDRIPQLLCPGWRSLASLAALAAAIGYDLPPEGTQSEPDAPNRKVCDPGGIAGGPGVPRSGPGAAIAA